MEPTPDPPQPAFKLITKMTVDELREAYLITQTEAIVEQLNPSDDNGSKAAYWQLQATIFWGMLEDHVAGH